MTNDRADLPDVGSSAIDSPQSQVALVQAVPYSYPAAHLIFQFLFTIRGGGALWEYTPTVGLVKGERGELYSVEYWLTEFVNYPAHGATEAQRHLERLASLHADLDTQR